MSGLKFCESIQPTLLEHEARTIMGFVDDIDSEGEVSHDARDVQAIMDSNASTGLTLNPHKCEITARNFNIVDQFPIFHNFKRIAFEDITLLGAPVLEGRTVDNALKDKIVTLERSITRLSTFQTHDALCLLKNSIAMPKLLYILRTSPCANNPLLQVFDMKLKEGLQTILNVELSDLQWKQASLPVHMGDLGVRSACMQATSAFLASAVATLPLQEAILSSSLAGVDDKAVSIAKAVGLICPIR